MIASLLLLILGTASATYQPGTPGGKWSDEQAEIIRDKLHYLWQDSNPNKFVRKFVNKNSIDNKNGDIVENNHWVYDPYRRLETVDCAYYGLCQSYWSGKRWGNMAFTPPKALRLAFHDCMPYKDGPSDGGANGCDGCLDFDNMENDHNVLQPTVAMLEMLYTDANWPEDAPALSASPKDLGFSRADLWQFTGLVALDYLQVTSKNMCEEDVKGLTCNDWPATECYSKFKGKARNLFKTGRVDCIPKYQNDPNYDKFNYIAKHSEIAPAKNGNGDRSTTYFRENFNLNPKEAVALMGAHTVGGYSTFQEHTDYAWTREKGSRRNEVFNNEYFKNLAADQYPARVKDKYCVGTMEDTAPEHKWYVNNLQFEAYWPQHKFYNHTCAPNCEYPGGASKMPWIERERRLQWNHFVYRGPVCDIDPSDTIEEDRDGDGDTFWNDDTLTDAGKPNNYATNAGADKYAQERGFDTFWAYCCNERSRNCGATNDCDQKCNRAVQSRLRFLSSDVGFYLKWGEDENGYPEGCGAFSDMRKGRDNDWKGNKWHFPRVPAVWDGNFTDIAKKGRPGQCEFQDIPETDADGAKPLYQTVRDFAKNNQKWVNSFVDVWEKMVMNGYDANQLVQGPKTFWQHLDL